MEASKYILYVPIDTIKDELRRQTGAQVLSTGVGDRVCIIRCR